MTDNRAPEAMNFIYRQIEDDIAQGRNSGKVATRFPPEPNGYLHIGHAKSICLNFGIAADYYGSICNLRMDDTNPSKEDQEYVDSIKDDVLWMGFKWNGDVLYASDYFDRIHQYAFELIRAGKAFVDSLTADEIREHRGTLTEPGRESPHRNRSVEENLDLFTRMSNGEFPDGAYVLRAKIDMSSGNINMRDPVIYRILRATHHRAGDKWCVYPMYDFAHPISDAIEGITHSICTLEFEDHRPLYDWFLDQLDPAHFPSRPRQIEFARLNLSHTILSKRRLIELVTGKHVGGWDDPRMPTIAGIRRRGFPPEAIRDFCDRIGVAKRDSMVDMALLEHCVRENLNLTAERRMGVLNPIKVVITNYPEAEEEYLTAINNPENPEAGSRTIPFCRELFIEAEDFMEEPPKKFFRLSPGAEVRLRYAYFIKCEKVVKDDEGNIVELHCTYDPATKGGDAPDGRKVKATIHWVSAKHSVRAEIRLIDRLFDVPNPSATKDGKTWLDHLNPKSLELVKEARLEPYLSQAEPGMRFQFERIGYFIADTKDFKADAPVFNRIVALKDQWAKFSGS